MKQRGYLTSFIILLNILFVVACNKVDVDYSSSSINNLKFKLVGENSSNSDIKLYRNQVFTIDYRKKDKINSDLKIKIEYALIDNSKVKVSDVLSDFKTEDTLKSADELLKFRMQVQPTLPTNEFMNLKVKFSAEDNSIEFVPSELVIKIDNSTVPPSAVTVTSPPAGSFINVSNQNNFEITGTCDQGNSIELSSSSAQSLVFFPGPLPCLNNSFSTGALDLTGFFDGPIKIDFKQKNQLGEVSPVSSLLLIKDTVLPSVTIGSHSSNAIIDTSSVSTFTLSGTCTENGNVVEVLGDLIASPNPVCSAGGWSTTLDAVNLSDGSFSLIIKHRDNAGNLNTSLSISLIKSSSGIIAVLGPKPNTYSNANTFNISVSGNNITAYKYALNKSLTDCSLAVYSAEQSILSPITKMTDATGNLSTSSLSLGDGTYTLCVLGKHSTGVYQSMSAATMYSWIYDNTPPVVGSINDGFYSNSNSSLPMITWSGMSDATSGILSYSIAIGTSSGGTDVLNWTDVGLSTSYTAGASLIYGTKYYASVKVIDKASNTSVINSDGWWVTQPLEVTPNSLSMITGESLNFNSLMSGGIPAFTGSSSLSNLNSSSLIYNILLNANPATDNVTITDSATQTANITVNIRAFQDKFTNYGYQGNSGSIIVNDLKRNPITGDLYSANSEFNSNYVQNWVVKKSSDGGINWTVVDTFNFDSNSYSFAKAITFDSSGNIYVVGSAIDQQSIEHWIIRKSSDNGDSWFTLLNYQQENGYSARGNDIVFDQNSGKLFSVGSAKYSTSSGVIKWLVISLNQDGSGVVNLSNFDLNSVLASSATGIALDGNGFLYVAGYASNSSGGTSWIVRKSTDFGANWTTIDNYTPLSGYLYWPQKIKVNTTGNIYVVGQGFLNSGYSSWIVRASSDGNTWIVSDSFSLVAGFNSGATNLDFDSSGNAVVVGSGSNGSGQMQLIARLNNGLGWSTVVQQNLSGYSMIGNLSAVVVNGSTLIAAGYSNDSNSNTNMMILKSLDSGNNWTSSNFINLIRPPNVVNDIKELGGNLFIGGYESDLNFIKSWSIKKSSDGGSSFNSSENYNLVSNRNSILNSISVSTTMGYILASGYGEDNLGGARWLTRKSTDQGVSWSTIDDYVYQPNYASIANASFIDSFGNIYVVGESKSSSQGQKWVVRKSADAGISWSNMDSYNSVGLNASAQGVEESLGNIVVIGYDQIATGTNGLIRYSPNNGISWISSDIFRYATAYPTKYTTITKDNLGNLYVSGHIVDSSGVAKWLIRKSTDKGGSWSTVYDQNFVSGKDSEIHRLSTDSDGNIYASGVFTAADNSKYLVITKSKDKGLSWVTIDKKAVSKSNSLLKGFSPCLTNRLCAGLSVEDSLFLGKKWLLKILSPLN